MDKSDNRKGKVFEPVVMCIIVVLMVIFSVKVKGEDDIGALESKKAENESKQAEAQSQAGELESSKSQLEQMVVNFNNQMESLAGELNDLDAKIKDKERAIRKTKKELKQAKKDEKEQYNSMKDRIQFLFEAGNTNYLEILMSDGSITENLNKAEYFSQLYEYDRQMLKKYQDTKDKISDKNDTLNVEKGELDGLKKDTEAKQVEIANMIAESNQKIADYQSKISQAESQAAEFEAKADEAESEIDEWHAESLRQQEESILKQQQLNAKNGETESYDAYNYTATELDLLACLIQAEAEDQPYYGKLAVGSVVMNRMDNRSFPDTMAGVLYQPYQFTPVTVNHRFANILARGANEECYKAAREVMAGNRVGSWLYFRMNDGSRVGTVIGDHVFY